MSAVFDLNLKKHDLFVYLFIILIVVLLGPYMIRFNQGNTNLIGTEPYYHAGLAEQILESGSLKEIAREYDLTYVKRTKVFTPYHFMLAGLALMTGVALASQLLPIIFGFLTVLVFYLILEQLEVEQYKRYIVLLLLAISPAFIYTYTFSNPHGAAIFFTLLAFYFFIKPKKMNLFFSLLSLTVVSLFSIFNSILAIFVILIYVFNSRKKEKWFLASVFVLFVVSIIKFSDIYYNYLYSPDLQVFRTLISDLGGITGFGIFIFILAILGAVFYWKEKKIWYVFYIISAVLLASLSYMGNSTNLYLNFFVVIAASAGFLRLHNMRWKLRSVRNLTILVMICGLLFSTVSYMNVIVRLEPNQAVIDSLDWLEQNSEPGSIVLSHYTNGYWIEEIAERPVLVDEYATNKYKPKFLYKVADSIFYSRNLKQAKEILANYDIKYIWINPGMRSGLVWEEENQGLLFLLRDTETFKKAYSRDGIEIWQVINATI